MSTPSPGARAVSALEISDVFLVESRCYIARDFNPMEQNPRLTFQHKISPEKNVLVQIRKEAHSDEELNVVRYFIDGGFRVLRPNVAADQGHAAQADVLAEIIVKMAVDYLCPRDFFDDQAAMGAFSKNAVFHSWSYWRTIIHSLSDHMRLPRLTLPMLRQQTTSPIELERPREIAAPNRPLQQKKKKKKTKLKRRPR
jgi:hypothetical protein